MKIESGHKIGLVQRLLILAGILLIAGLVSIGGTVQWWSIDVTMAIVALAVCVVSTQAAHVAGEYPRGDDNYPVRLAVSMFARTCLPFLLVISAKLVDAIPFEPPLVLFVILFYLIGLIADISLHVLRFRPSQ